MDEQDGGGVSGRPSSLASQGTHWAHDRLLLKVKAGSQAHGLNTPDSDLDTRGVCVPPKQFLLGLSTFEQWQSEGGDHVIFSLQKFARLALDGNPNIIETLYTREEDRIFLSPVAKPLIEERDLFLSKQVGVKFGRYAVGQLKKIERHNRWLTSAPPVKPHPTDFGAVESENSPKFPDTASERAYRGAVKHYRSFTAWRKNRNPERAELEAQHGYDTKHAMHLCRLLKMGIEILTTGEVSVFRQDREFLLGVRGGRFSYQELLDWVEEKSEALSEAETNSALPEQPDSKRGEELVVQMTEQFLIEAGECFTGNGS